MCPVSCKNGINCKDGISCNNDFCKTNITIDKHIEIKAQQIDKLEKIMRSLDRKIEKINLINQKFRRHSIEENVLIKSNSFYLANDKNSNCPISDIGYNVSTSTSSETVNSNSSETVNSNSSKD